MEDRSELFNQLKGFSQRKLKKVETKVVTGSGEQLVEKRGAKGLQVLSGSDATKGQDAEPTRKLDLQVGLIVPGLLIGSQDVAHDKSSLECYGVTHVLNLDSEIENKFEDDYNYKNIDMQDKPDFDLNKVLDDCFDFIDDGRHYGNVLVHCSGTIGLSRSTSICIAYLMDKEKQSFNDAFNNVKEARSFVKPNEGFIKQLKDYEVKLRGAQQVKDSGIDDPFALRKKQEIEQEKAMVAGATSVKNRMKMFGATLNTTSNNNDSSRSKSVSPSPFKTTPSTPASNKTPTGSWRDSNLSPKLDDSSSKSISKSMTPEPRKSWQQPESDWRSNKIKASADLTSTGGPPPPPPPMPSGDLLAKDKSIRSLNSNKSSMPPPPPPPPAGDLMTPRNKSADEKQKPLGTRPSLTQLSDQDVTTTTSNSQDSSAKRMVFGRVPPPPMKIKGGLSIEKDGASCDKTLDSNRTNQQSRLQLPLKKQITTDSDIESKSENTRAPSPSAALRAAKQEAATRQRGDQRDGSSPVGDHRQSVTGQLNRSSTKKLLNLIKTKTKSDLTLPDGDENDEIEALLGALESESIDNIDWDELGLDEDEVKDIIQQGGDGTNSSSSSSDSEDSQDEEYEEEEVKTQHFVIRTK